MIIELASASKYFLEKWNNIDFLKRPFQHLNGQTVKPLHLPKNMQEAHRLVDKSYDNAENNQRNHPRKHGIDQTKPSTQHQEDDTTCPRHKVSKAKTSSRRKQRSTGSNERCKSKHIAIHSTRF